MTGPYRQQQRNQQPRVLAHSCRPHAPMHEVETNRALARWLADLQGLEFGGDFDPAVHGGTEFYLVPTQTIVGSDQRELLGLTGPTDLFGGYVEHGFVATKAIVHPLQDVDAVAPDGWSRHFSEQVHDVVLDGVTAFCPADARRAAVDLLAAGPLRIKPIHACGGREQHVVNNLAAFEALLADPAMAAIFDSGVVLEEELGSVQTFSVGQLQVGPQRLSYYGRQYTTEDGRGGQAYGGSELVVTQGSYQDLLALEPDSDTRLAIRQAQVFDTAVNAEYPTFFASRRNYDIAHGIDRRGRWRSCVLEQSWRMGGASSAEILALRAFREQPSLTAVRASSVEIYHDRPLPDRAVEFFRGDDSEVGFIIKYAMAVPL